MAQTDGQTGNSMTESAKWGQFSENLIVFKKHFLTSIKELVYSAMIFFLS